MSEHTKGEWTIKQGNSGMMSIYGNGNASVCACGCPDEAGVNEANARRICQCVNNFDKLLEALGRIAIHSDDPDMATLAQVTIAEVEKAAV